jgi:hypothetical protein
MRGSDDALPASCRPTGWARSRIVAAGTVLALVAAIVGVGAGGAGAATRTTKGLRFELHGRALEITVTGAVRPGLRRKLAGLRVKVACFGGTASRPGPRALGRARFGDPAKRISIRLSRGIGDPALCVLEPNDDPGDLAVAEFR